MTNPRALKIFELIEGVIRKPSSRTARLLLNEMRKVPAIPYRMYNINYSAIRWDFLSLTSSKAYWILSFTMTFPGNEESTAYVVLLREWISEEEINKFCNKLQVLTLINHV